MFSLISEVDWEGPQASLVDLTQVYQLQYRIRLLSKRLLKAQCCNIKSLQNVYIVLMGCQAL